MKLRARPEDRGLRLDVFLSQRLENLTRSQIQLLNRSGAIQVEGRHDKAGYRIRGGENIDVDLRILEFQSLTPEQMSLQIYFEDEHLAIIEKPAGVVVHPGSGTRQATVVHGLLFHFKNLSDAGGIKRPGIVHRLDKWTSGLMIVAKNNVAHAKLSKAFQDRDIQKTYLALVHGKPRQEAGVIESAIGRHPKIRTRMAAMDQGRGRSAYTAYATLEQFRDFTLLELKIKTGRTHQIRVHLSSIGLPVVGDDVYGEKHFKQFVRKYGEFHRYFLHAAELRFTHPATGMPLEFHSPLPIELQKILNRIRS
jgi:23S rRNA pseudouridine1911/1915/1917 synthase